MKKLTLLATAMLLALKASAGVFNLSDFTTFTPSFYGLAGSWSADTALSNPTTFTIADFGNGAPKNDGSFTVNLGSAQDFSTFQYVHLVGSAASGNTTGMFSFFVEDINSDSGLATFNMSDFAAGFGTANLSGMYSQLDPTQIVRWGFSTENQLGDESFAFNFDQVSLSTISVIPEPSTFAAGIGALAFLGVVWMRRRRAASAN